MTGLPLYDVAADVHPNRAGPRGILPWLSVGNRTVSPESRATLFGRRVRGVVGVPACPLTANASWVSALAGAGFDVITTKTVRSDARPAHPFPQWLLGTAVPVEADAGADPESGAGVVLDPAGSGPVSSANSFGVPSPDPTVWRADLQRCRRVLAPGQVLIASVMGSPELYSGNDLVTDFVRVARLAAETGVEAVELNLSCPNTLHSDGTGANAPLCADPNAVSAVVGAVRLALPATVSIVAKLSTLPPTVLHDVVGRLAPHVQAIAGINAVQRRVFDDVGGPAFGPERERAGLSGAAIREQGLDFVRAVFRRRAELGAHFDILGMGGILMVADVVAFRAAGADIVQSATGACLDPQLANDSRRFR
jgi:dihydroorotate dehydrogenase